MPQIQVGGMQQAANATPATLLHVMHPGLADCMEQHHAMPNRSGSAAEA